MQSYGGITSKSYNLNSIKFALKKAIKLFNETNFDESNLDNIFDIETQLKNAIN